MTQFQLDGLSGTAPAAAKAKRETVVPEAVGAFFNALSNLQGPKRLRVTYSAFTKILVKAGSLSQGCEKVPIACCPHINKLPIGQQWMVCKKGGKYDDSAIAKWRQAAPPDFATIPVAKDDAVVAAFHAGISAKEA